MKPFRIPTHLAVALVVTGATALSFAPAVSAQGACGVPVKVAASQSILPPITVAPGQDLQVHLMNRRNQELTVAVAYRLPGEDEPIGRVEGTLAPGERTAVQMSDSCLQEDPCSDIICVESRSLQTAAAAATDCVVVEGEAPLPVQPVVSVVYEQPINSFKPPEGFVDPVFGFVDPVFGFVDPVFGFDNPLAGFDNPLAGFDNPLAGFELVDVETGRTEVWGTGGIHLNFAAD